MLKISRISSVYNLRGSALRYPDISFNIIYIMRIVIYGAGALWWADLKPGSGLDHSAAVALP
jgi:hypothetical protein